MRIAITIAAIILLAGFLTWLWWGTAEIDAQKPGEQGQILTSRGWEYPRCVPPTVSLGISKAELLATCGPPKHINHQLLANGQIDKEQWSYDGIYVYLEHGRLDGIQYAENGETFHWVSN